MVKRIAPYFIAIIIWFFLLAKASLAKNFTLPPEKIIIPSLHINLPIIKVKIIENETWEVSYQYVSYGESTALPGNKGNTVIFAHALPHLFYHLPKIKKGDLIHIFTKNDWFIYKVTEMLIVDPNNISVLTETQNNQLILYTCTGKDWQQRFLVKAQLAY
jgi:LPXTG-site transpeptidase (sortase) family protein